MYIHTYIRVCNVHMYTYTHAYILLYTIVYYTEYYIYDRLNPRYKATEAVAQSVPKPYPLNPKHSTLNPQPEAVAKSLPKPHTLNPKH